MGWESMGQLFVTLLGSMYCSRNRSNTLPKYFLMVFFVMTSSGRIGHFVFVMFCKKLFAAVSKRYYELAQMNIVAWVSATWICPTGIMELCHAGSMSCCSKLWHKESYISMNHVLYIHQIKHGHGDGTLIVWRVGCLGPGPLASCRPPFKPIRPNYK